jgi:O-methyltransferase involved in polyketide biosynthesis
MANRAADLHSLCALHSADDEPQRPIPETLDDPNTASLAGVPATLLMPLWARAIESSHQDALLQDPRAADIVRSIPFDFDAFVRKRVPVADYCIRASIIDALVRRRLERVPQSTIVELGVGLDARFERADNGAARWIEFDLPEVIRLRKRFFVETSQRSMLEGSVLDDNWLDAIEQLSCRSPLFVAEGMLYFLSRGQVMRLFDQLARRFPGSAIVFDAQSPLLLRVSNLRHPLSGARLRFSLKGDAAEIERWDPRFHVREYVGFGDSPYYDGAIDRLSSFKRFLTHFRRLSRHAFKIVQVEFR